MSTLLKQPWPYEELGAASVEIEIWLNKILLANQHINRIISPTNQERLQEAMRESEWVDETGEPIILSKDMRLCDGQNRLKAAQDTNTTIRVVVIWGIPVERRRAINIGKKRSGADQSAIEEIPDPKHQAAAVQPEDAGAGAPAGAAAAREAVTLLFDRSEGKPEPVDHPA